MAQTDARKAKPVLLCWDNGDNRQLAVTMIIITIMIMTLLVHPPKRCPSINYHQDNCADKVKEISINSLRDDRFEHLFSTS